MVATPRVASPSTMDGSARRMVRTTTLIVDLRSDLGEHGDVDGVLAGLAADRAHGQVDVAQTVGVAGQPLEREATRGELGEGELAGAIAVSAGAAKGDGLLGEFFDREVGERGQLALDQECAGTALERVNAEQHWGNAGTGRAVEHDVYSFSAGDGQDPIERILGLNVDHMIRAKGLGQLEAGRGPGRGR